MNFPFGTDILFALLAGRLPAYSAPRVAAALAEIAIGTGILFEGGFFLAGMSIHFLVYVSIRGAGKYSDKIRYAFFFRE